MRAVTVVPIDPATNDDSASPGRRPRPGPEQLHVIEVDDLTPASDEVLISTAAAGVNRADLLQRQGLYPPPSGISEVIGLEVSGTILALGDKVTGWQIGDQVVALLAGGGYAEQVVVPAGQVLPIPDGIDLITAATLIEVAATVVSNFDHVALSEGETVLIHGGAGGVGSFAIQYAKALGCRVATTAGTAAKLEHCRGLGADIVLNYHDDWVAGLREQTDGRGADVILDVMGAKYLPLNVSALAPDGRCVVIGMQGGTKGELNLGALLAKRATVTATSLRGRPAEQKAEICARVRDVIWPLYASGQLRPAPIDRFSLDEVAAAHARLESGEVTGKLVLVVDPDA